MNESPSAEQQAEGQTRDERVYRITEFQPAASAQPSA